MFVRRSEERGNFDFGWLRTFHSFSFGEYFDRNHMHFSDLRVLNHDFIAPATGFPTHPHKDMEIITYVLSGVVEHQDSMGNKTQIQAGEIQTMSAGTGVFHSEYNPSSSQELELIQMWIMPRKKGGNPSYAQKKFTIEARKNKFLKIISGDQSEKFSHQSQLPNQQLSKIDNQLLDDQSALPIAQDTEIYASIIEKDMSVEFTLQSDKKYWTQVVQGQVQVLNQSLRKGDALAIDPDDQASRLLFRASEDAEILLFELRQDL